MNAAIMERAQRGAEKLAANAKDGTLIIDGVKYQLTFDRYACNYVVTDPAGVHQVNFNTRSLQTARKWLREYMA